MFVRVFPADKFHCDCECRPFLLPVLMSYSALAHVATPGGYYTPFLCNRSLSSTALSERGIPL